MMAELDINLVLIDVPQCEAGASSPIIVADDEIMVFGYSIQNSQVEAARNSVAIIRVESCFIHKFGAPNDEALHGHPYTRFGLKPYNGYEVLQSDWVRDLIAANRVHHRHLDSLFSDHRHFIFAFQDSTLEFVTSSDLAIKEATGNVGDVVVSEFLQRT